MFVTVIVAQFVAVVQVWLCWLSSTALWRGFVARQLLLRRTYYMNSVRSVFHQPALATEAVEPRTSTRHGVFGGELISQTFGKSVVFCSPV